MLFLSARGTDRHHMHFAHYMQNIARILGRDIGYSEITSGVVIKA